MRHSDWLTLGSIATVLNSLTRMSVTRPVLHLGNYHHEGIRVPAFVPTTVTRPCVMHLHINLAYFRATRVKSPPKGWVDSVLRSSWGLGRYGTYQPLGRWYSSLLHWNKANISKSSLQDLKVLICILGSISRKGWSYRPGLFQLTGMNPVTKYFLGIKKKLDLTLKQKFKSNLFRILLLTLF